MTRQEIQTVVSEIMINDGPDSSDSITDFIIALIDGQDGVSWFVAYMRKINGPRIKT